MNNWKVRIVILAVVLFAVIAMVVSNCSGGGGGIAPDLPGNNPPEGGGGVTPSSNLKEVDQLGLTLTGIEGDIYYYSFSGQAPDIKVGDILSGPENGGYLKEVTNVQNTGTQLIVNTSQAIIDDAIESGTLATTLDFTTRLTSYNRTPQTFSAVTIPLTGTVIYSDSTINVEITEGSVTFAPKFNLEMRFDPSKGLTYFKGAAVGELDYNFQVKATGSADFDLAQEKHLFSSPLRSFKVGPIWGAVKFDFYGGVDIDGIIDENIDAGVISSMTTIVGAEFANGAWGPLANQSHNFTARTIGGNADGAIVYKAYIRPEAVLLLAGFEGPGLSYESNFELNGTGRLSPPCLIYDMSAGLVCNTFVNTSIICRGIPNYSVEILNVSENIDSGSIGDCDGTGCQELMVNAIVGPSEVDGGGAVEYSVTAGGDTGITYSWSCDPSYKGTFENANTSTVIFHPIKVTSPLQVTVKVLVRSDSCPNGITKNKVVTIVDSGCPYDVSQIMGASMMLEQQTKFYSIMVSSYSIQAMSFNWTCDPPDAGYFLSNDMNIVEFFANSVSEDTVVTLEVDVDSDICDQITREKKVTIEDQGSVGN